MALILDEIFLAAAVAGEVLPGSTGILVPDKKRMPASDSYIALAIGPASDHDVVRVRYPGVDSLLWRGIVLPMVPSAQNQQVSIDIVQHRAMGGRVQVLGLTAPEEVSALARVRAPNTQETVLTVVAGAPANASQIVVPYGGRNTVNVTATVGGEVGDPAPTLTVQTLGLIYRFNQSAAVVEDNPEFVDFPMNLVPWGAGLSFSYNEEEPEFDQIVYQFIHTGEVGSPDIVVWTKWEARD